MPKTRNVYKEGTRIKSMCRVCLTRSNNVMFNLTDKLAADNYEADTYLEALEKVTCAQVEMNGRYPEGICPMCVSILKMALLLVTQFQDSQERLKKMFKSNSPTYESIKLEYEKENDDDEEYMKTEEIRYDSDDPSNVQLIIKDKTFNLNELVVVEEAAEGDDDFNGFIGNLGNEISATVVDKNENMNENISIIKVENEEDTDEHEEEIEINGEESIEYIIETLEDEDGENQPKPDLDSETGENDDTDSQKQSDNDNLEYIELDMYDKDAIESLIIDRSKLSDYCDEGSDEPTQRRKKRKKNEDEKDEFLKEVKFPCGICKNIYQSKHSLRTHIRRSHMRKYEKSFTCEICGTFCRSRSAFVNHKLKHFDKQFKCDICDKSYTTKAHLKVHKLAHDNTRPYLCNVCGKDFNYSNALTYHMRLHTGEKNYHCEYCPKRFRMINSLNRHLRTHTGEKPYKCQYCGRDFSSRGEVVCHEYIHTGYRPYHCKYCKKGFSKTHNLKIHLLSHGGPFHCQFCNKTFIEKNILAMHHKISHKDVAGQIEMQDGSEEDSPDSQDGVEDIVKIEVVEDFDMEYADGEEVDLEEDISE